MKRRVHRRSRDLRAFALGACLVLVGALTLLPARPGGLHADQEAGNRPHVVAGRWGSCYARSVPQDRYGTRGLTDVFRVGRQPEDDVKLAS